MKLNPDCIRDLLMSIEKVCSYERRWAYSKDSPLPELFPKYSHEEILYHLRYCANADLLNGTLFVGNGSFVKVGDLTPSGHEFLANIRNDTFFNKVKAIAAELGVNSLNDLTQIAINSAALIIKSHFGLL